MGTLPLGCKARVDARLAASISLRTDCTASKTLSKLLGRLGIPRVDKNLLTDDLSNPDDTVPQVTAIFIGFPSLKLLLALISCL